MRAPRANLDRPDFDDLGEVLVLDGEGVTIERIVLRSCEVLKGIRVNANGPLASRLEAVEGVASERGHSMETQWV